MSELTTQHSQFQGAQRTWGQEGTPSRIPGLPQGSFPRPQIPLGCPTLKAVRLESSRPRLTEASWAAPHCRFSCPLTQDIPFVLAREEGAPENASDDGTQANLHNSAEHWSPCPQGQKRANNTCPRVPNGTCAEQPLITTSPHP